MQKVLLIFVLVFTVCSIKAQDDNPKSQKTFYGDFVMGPYLILDGTIYESVFLRGMRLGYETEKGIAIGVEYLAGHQEDLQGQLGTTHSAFGTLKYYRVKKDADNRFRWYGLAGGGFMEFKDFSADVYGIAFYLSLGLEMNFSENIKGFLEPRYVNTGLMNANGTHQLGVMWGVSGRF